MDEPDAKFVCLNVRDSAYLSGPSWDYHSYRDSNIENYILAAETLANRGYYVLRMGAKVNQELKSYHSKIIDYATNGMRNDFMDIFLGARCHFAISTGSGWDAIPEIFRRPIAYVNYGPAGFFPSFSEKNLGIIRHHVLEPENRELSLSEIFSNKVGFCLRTSDYERQNIRLLENTSEEIRDVVVEMDERLSGTWVGEKDDDFLQIKFWEMFQICTTPSCAGRHLHGQFKSRFGAQFLRNPKFLQ